MTDSSGKSVIVNATLVARAHYMARRTLVNDSSRHLWTQPGPADFLATRLLGDNKVSYNSNVSPVPDIVLSRGDSFVSIYGRMMLPFIILSLLLLHTCHRRCQAFHFYCT